jgi:hypothetical protein
MGRNFLERRGPRLETIVRLFETWFMTRNLLVSSVLLVISLSTLAEIDLHPAVHFLSESQAKMAKIYAGWKGYRCESMTQSERNTVARILDKNGLCATNSEASLAFLDDLYFHDQAKQYKEALGCELQKTDCLMKASNALKYGDLFMDYDLPYYGLMLKWLHNEKLSPDEEEHLKNIDQNVPDEVIKETFVDSCKIHKILKERMPVARFNQSKGDCFESTKMIFKMMVWEKYVTAMYNEDKDPIFNTVLHLIPQVESVDSCEVVKKVGAAMQFSMQQRRHQIENQQNRLARSCEKGVGDASGCFYRPIFPMKSELVDFGFSASNPSLSEAELRAMEKYYCHLNLQYAKGREDLNKDIEDRAIPVLGVVIGGYWLRMLSRPFFWIFEPIKDEVALPGSLVAAKVVRSSQRNAKVRAIRDTAIGTAKTGVATVSLTGLGLTAKNLSKACFDKIIEIQKQRFPPTPSCQCGEVLQKPFATLGGDCQLEVVRNLIEKEMAEVSQFAAHSKTLLSVAEKSKGEMPLDSPLGEFDFLMVKTFSSNFERAKAFASDDLPAKLEKLRAKYIEGRKSCGLD